MSPARHGLCSPLGHELRNPLASALTGAMLARDMIGVAEPGAIVLDGVLKDLNRITGLIDGWLAMDRGQQGTQTRIDVEELLSRIADSQRVEVICAPPAFAVMGDVVLLERAIESLCENARDAGAVKIRIAAQHDGSHIDIHIEDDGHGIDADDVESIFGVGCSRSGSPGLGLHAVAMTVAACNGEVRCVPLPAGARFTISLPRAELALS